MCLAGCASSGLKIIPAGELGEAGGTPSISGVIDRGGGDIAGSGTLAPVTGDGIAVIGEVLHVRGRNFGRQPTVTIGGAATAVVARSADGGILVRVPPGTPAGQQRLVVTNEEGRTEHALTIRRLVMGRVGARLAWFNLAATGPTLVGETNVEGARATAMSRDGRAGYVIDGAGNLLTFELPAQGRPETRERLAVAQPVRALLAAPAVARLFVVAAESLIEIDTTMPLHPVLGATRPLPVRVHGSKPLPMAVSPDGRRLALALPERNRVMIVDVAALQGETPPAAELALAPEVLAPVLIDLTFAPDGRTLWVLSGSGPENQSVGPQPTRVHAIRITESPAGAPPTLAVARVVPIDAARQLCAASRDPASSTAAAMASMRSMGTCASAAARSNVNSP